MQPKPKEMAKLNTDATETETETKGDTKQKTEPTLEPNVWKAGE